MGETRAIREVAQRAPRYANWRPQTPSSSLDTSGPPQIINCGASGVRRARGGQGEVESCAAFGGAGGPQAAPMRLNDRPTDGQAHTGPLVLGRNDRPEDLVCLLRGKSHTGIADRDQQLSVAGFRLEGELTSVNRSLPSVNAVEHQVHENLLQLHRVRHNLGKIRGQVQANGDRVAVRFAAQQDKHFSNEFIYIN